MMQAISTFNNARNDDEYLWSLYRVGSTILNWVLIGISYTNNDHWQHMILFSTIVMAVRNNLLFFDFENVS